MIQISLHADLYAAKFAKILTDASKDLLVAMS